MLNLRGLHLELKLKSSVINMVDTLGFSYPKEKLDLKLGLAIF